MRVIAALLLAAATVAAASPALAGRAVSLKADTVSADTVVTLGDLFEGAGAAGRLAVAQRDGTTVTLDAGQVQAAARRAGLDWDNPDGLRKIVVRAGLAVQGAGGQGNVQVLTYTRSLNAGDIVEATDLAWTKAAAAPTGAPSDADQVIGMAAKRPIRAGAAVMTRDVGSAQVIAKGDEVVVTYDAGGVTLTLQGKAQSAAGVGENLSVLNPASKKVIQTVVTGPGTAVVGPAALDMKSNRSVRYAVR